MHRKAHVFRTRTLNTQAIIAMRNREALVMSAALAIHKQYLPTWFCAQLGGI